jgi:hypothetical protein
VATYLGWGEITVHRYETCAIPDSVHNDLLLLLQDEEAMHKFVAGHTDRLSERDKQSVEAAIAGRVREVNERALRAHLLALIDSRSMAERGNRHFDFERLEHMIVFFAERLRPSRTKLNKLLWYADFLAFKRQSISLSGAPYLRFQYGPVPEHYERLVAEVVSDGLVTEDLTHRYSAQRSAPCSRRCAIDSPISAPLRCEISRTRSGLGEKRRRTKLYPTCLQRTFL